MADPVIKPCAKGVWTKVATNVTAATVWKKKTSPNAYYQTYRDTGTAAPTDLADAIPIVEPGQTFSFGAAADIYIYAKGKAGSVRVDS